MTRMFENLKGFLDFCAPAPVRKPFQAYVSKMSTLLMPEECWAVVIFDADGCYASLKCISRGFGTLEECIMNLELSWPDARLEHEHVASEKFSSRDFKIEGISQEALEEHVKNEKPLI